MSPDLTGLSRTRRYLVGVSGGRDSVALLHVLLQSGFRRLIVCHLDHGLRGRQGAGDARFVERLAAAHTLPVVIHKADVMQLAAERRASVETAARDARLAFFASVARSRRCRMLFLGHHADDQVETLLFNLCRGSGRAGLGGMRPRSDRAGLTILRPLLGVWRAEIDAFIAKERLEYREDASNADPRHTRNRVRHALIPALEAQLGREVRHSIWRAAEILGAEEEWLAEQTPAPSEELSVAGLRAMPAALQRRLIRRWLGARGVRDAGFFEIENVRALIPPGAPLAKVNLPKGRHARRRAGSLFVE